MPPTPESGPRFSSFRTIACSSVSRAETPRLRRPKGGWGAFTATRPRRAVVDEVGDSAYPRLVNEALHVRAPGTADWDDLIALFGETRGADGGCFCMYWRRPASEYRAGPDARIERRDALRAIIQDGRPSGLIAHRGRKPVGWCGVSPRESFTRLHKSRTYLPVEEMPIWSIVCFYVELQERGRGVAAALLDAAVEHAKAAGAALIEAYAVDAGGADLTPGSAFPGTVDMYVRAGFKQIAVRGRRHVMRRPL